MIGSQCKLLDPSVSRILLVDHDFPYQSTCTTYCLDLYLWLGLVARTPFRTYKVELHIRSFLNRNLASKDEYPLSWVLLKLGQIGLSEMLFCRDVRGAIISSWERSKSVYWVFWEQTAVCRMYVSDLKRNGICRYTICDKACLTLDSCRTY